MEWMPPAPFPTELSLASRSIAFSKLCNKVKRRGCTLSPRVFRVSSFQSGSKATEKSLHSLVSAKSTATSSDIGDTCFDIRYYHRGLSTSTTPVELFQLRKLDHENVNKFVGLSADGPEYIAVWRMCERGTLQVVISSGTMTIDSFFVICLIKDIAEGINYIHQSFLPYIGTLSSATCLVSEGWQVKLSSFGLEHLATDESALNDPLYTAPELLRNKSQIMGTKQADLYSFAIVCSEVITRRPAWNGSEDREEIEGKSAIFFVDPKGGPSAPRPQLDRQETDVDQGLIDLVTGCWSENPNDRLAIDVVCNRLARIKQGSTKTNLMDHLFDKLEVHTADLEKEVRTELMEHKKNADLLLGKMLPRQVAEQLKRGQTVEPESFDTVTVFFCDVVKFTQLAAKCLPLHVISLLNELFSAFDQIIEEHDAYKVESIGDGYLCVSGLPERNGFNHIKEIVEMSFRFMDYVSAFRIPSLPSERVEIRIGINSGPCVAGVVGLSMPRYCLFGDTVNTASRMESNGKPSHIHLSDTSQKLLSLHFPGQYEIVSRGEVIIKVRILVDNLAGMREAGPHQPIRALIVHLELSIKRGRR
ncbi:unnamed protein product [Heligmosomoides polygyrus]|uniref:Guanylate cyclase n=1 Tax=Heligmosomoides polygyrus TaxID=6339 RepID=A0A3P8ADT3_HELPZ|nr:unnamed protein product [Heligmosomoides polygyrus]